jgi:sterol desaturase/sphingolipid hydroxylase (fatty acid hydroxylase superfamily)
LFLRRGRARTYDLGKMGLGDLIVAYITYPSIVLYLALAIGCTAGAVWLGAFESSAQTLRTLGSVAALLALYPFYEYAIHRFVLHNRLLYKSPLTADVWKRIHYDHHQDPNRLHVLFGSPSNTLLAIFAPSIPLGYAIGGWSTALMTGAVAASLFAFYEFCHCVQHLNFMPKSGWLRQIKKAHMAHHFHNETGNFGITLTFVDHLFGTYYGDSQTRPRSSHVYDLGYDETEARRYPWVAARSREPADQASAG